ncbi:MAG: phage portal protein [Isosphaeraceae bacterium]
MNWLRDFIGSIWPGWGGLNSPRQRWSGWGWLDGHLPGSSLDYEAEAGPPWLNPTVAACLGWYCDELPQSRFTVQQIEADGSIVPVWTHPLTKLIQKPNPFWTGEQLWQATFVDLNLDGNSYWLPMLSRAGLVVELWRLDPQHVEPQWPDDGSEWISHYLYQPEGSAWQIPRDRIVHFRDRIDPANPRKGLGRVKSVLREICTDNESSTYLYTLLKNLGQSGAVISPDLALDDAQAQALIRQIQQQTTGDRRFRALGSTIPLKTGRLGQSPEELRLDRIPKRIEAKICAVLGPSPIVLALPCAEDFATLANAQEATKVSWSRLQANQRNMAATVRTQLLPRVDPRPNLTCGWDWSEVVALQANAKELADRVKTIGDTQVLKRSELRELLGYEPLGVPALDDEIPVKAKPAPGSDPKVPPAEGDQQRAGGPAHAHFHGWSY